MSKANDSLFKYCIGLKLVLVNIGPSKSYIFDLICKMGIIIVPLIGLLEVLNEINIYQTHRRIPDI